MSRRRRRLESQPTPPGATGPAFDDDDEELPDAEDELEAVASASAPVLPASIPPTPNPGGGPIASPAGAQEPTRPRPAGMPGMLDGITFADDPGAALAAARANSAAAVDAVRRMRMEALQHPVEHVARKPAIQAPPAAEVVRPKLYRVVETMTLPRGASTVKFQQGKVLSANLHNISALQDAGLKLEELKSA